MAELCAGGTANCPPDAVLSSGTSCRAAAGACDQAETCDGVLATCPANAFLPASTVCRPAAAGGCDVAENCPGAAAACPADVFLPATTTCRPAVDLCDVAEKCPGNAAACPMDLLQPATFVCRGSVDLCDSPESCTGMGTACPMDVFKAAGAICRVAAAGGCDLAETCSGMSTACPANSFQPSSVVCRAVAGLCDVAESCTGAGAACPADAFLAGGTSCRPAVGACDAAETCSGAGSACPADASLPNGTSCDDNNVCNGVNSCQGGACQSGMVPNCNDNNPCTTDTCDPITGCKHTPVANGTACDDGLYCTIPDSCQGGTCTGTPRNCGTPADNCLISVCDEPTMACKLAPNPAGPKCQDNSIKPYMMVIVDTSGSMDAPTGAGLNSCGHVQGRLSDAKCVLSNIVNSYGDVVFGLERFKEVTSGVPSAAPAGCGTHACQTSCPDSCNACTVSTLFCGNCDPSAATAAAGNCPPTGGDADEGEVLTEIVDHQQDQILKWINYSVNGCGALATDPELSADTWTPIAGSLRTARRYFQGGDPTYINSPIDPTNACRPYYVILLTDGAESCTVFSDTLKATDELRATVFGAKTYDIKTYTIGIGIAPASPPAVRLQAIATHGGTTAFFATDEQSLALAFAQIIKASLLVEVCDGIDNNCNGLIDEGFTLYCDKANGHPVADLCTNPGDICDGVDDNCFDGTNDETHNACGTCGPVQPEICNGIDDNCDGQIDEGLNCTCFVQPEICDGIDNNCDGQIDENLTRACGSSVGACTPGIETCVMGAWVGCTATNGMPELCNNIDDNCDGVVDGIARSCGHPAIGACQPGTQVCTTGNWGGCVGNIDPVAELCDNVDNNCDGQVDEGNPGGGAGCNTPCGAGIVTCVNGMLVCVSQAGALNPEVCNGIDDNCNGLVDEGLDHLGPCTNGGLLCVPGESKCLAGIVQCVGGTPPAPEVCDCMDNNCNGQVDEGSPCGNGAKCLPAPDCQCAVPCVPSEFPCAFGFKCNNPAHPDQGFCVVDPCAGVNCPTLANGTAETCVNGKCVSVCSTITCTAPEVCRPSDGSCVQNNCIGLPDLCSAAQLCQNGVCVTDPCAGVTCPAAQFCRNGGCVDSCANVTCAPKMSCHDGACTGDLCGGVSCPIQSVCDSSTGKCTRDNCFEKPACPIGTACDPISGDCGPDPCLGVHCPGAQVCQKGDCFNPGDKPLVTPPNDFIAPIGGGGFTCEFGGGSGGGSTALLLLALALCLRWARRRGGAR